MGHFQKKEKICLPITTRIVSLESVLEVTRWSYNPEVIAGDRLNPYRNHIVSMCFAQRNLSSIQFTEDWVEQCGLKL